VLKGKGFPNIEEESLPKWKFLAQDEVVKGGSGIGS
jgi:hypothetical protein